MNWSATTMAGVLVALGALLAAHEWRSPAGESEDASSQSFFARRRKRRLRTATLVVALGLIVGAGQWINPDRHPILYILSWLAAAIIALWLMWLACLDYLATRLHWVDQTRRNLVEIAKARAELHALRAIERNGKKPS